MKKNQTKKIAKRKLAPKKIFFLRYAAIALLIVLTGASLAISTVKTKNNLSSSTNPNQTSANQTNINAQVNKAAGIAPNPNTVPEKSASTSEAQIAAALNASYDGRAGPLTVPANTPLATYPVPPKPDFLPSLLNSTVNLRFETSWQSSLSLASTGSPNWYDSPQIALLSIVGYDTNAVDIQTDFNGTPKQVINITVKYLKTPSGPFSTVPSGSTTAQFKLTDEFGRTATLPLTITWQ